MAPESKPEDGDRDVTTHRRPGTAKLELPAAQPRKAHLTGDLRLDDAQDSSQVLQRGCVPAAFSSVWRHARPTEAARVAERLAAGETVRINDLPLSVSARDRQAIEGRNLSPTERRDAYLQLGIMGAGRYLQGSPAERNAINASRGTAQDWDLALTRTGLGERGVAGLASRLDLPVKFVETGFSVGDFVAWGKAGDKHAMQIVAQRGENFVLADAYGQEWIKTPAEVRAGASLDASDDIGAGGTPKGTAAAFFGRSR